MGIPLCVYARQVRHLSAHHAGREDIPALRAADHITDVNPTAGWYAGLVALKDELVEVDIVTYPLGQIAVGHAVDLYVNSLTFAVLAAAGPAHSLVQHLATEAAVDVNGLAKVRPDLFNDVFADGL